MTGISREAMERAVEAFRLGAKWREHWIRAHHPEMAKGLSAAFPVLLASWLAGEPSGPALESAARNALERGSLSLKWENATPEARHIYTENARRIVGDYLSALAAPTGDTR